MRRAALLLVVCTACADTPPALDPGPSALDRVWTETIRPGDVMVIVPGTGARSGLGARIEEQVAATAPDQPVRFVARDYLVYVDPLEGAVAAVRRAGLDPSAVTYAMWGTGITKLDSFVYASADGADVTIDIIAGTSTCGDGGIPENLVNYNAANADKDARDLYQHARDYLAGGDPDRNVILVSHSWGGVDAEYFAANLATLEHDHGPLGAHAAFAIAAGVPGFVPGGFATFGEGFRTVESRHGDQVAAMKSYEIDRPDDPVHVVSPNANGGGHHYIIMVGDDFVGWYGITTDELACAGAPGICPETQP